MSCKFLEVSGFVGTGNETVFVAGLKHEVILMKEFQAFSNPTQARIPFNFVSFWLHPVQLVLMPRLFVMEVLPHLAPQAPCSKTCQEWT